MTESQGATGAKDPGRAVHFVLSHGDLVWQYRRAIDTAAVHDDAPVVLWYTGRKPPAPGCNTERIRVPAWLKGQHPAHVFDVLALKVLAEHGGMSLGLDTISIRSAWDLHEPGRELTVARGVPVAEHPYSNHLIADPGSEIVAEMLEEAERRVRDGDDRWGFTGPLLLTDFVERYSDRIGVAPYPTLVGWEGSEFWRFVEGEEPADDVRVIHLYTTAYPEAWETLRWPRVKPGRVGPSNGDGPDALRLHLVALPHTQMNDDFATCAYTQKQVKFCRMMTERGHQVILYGPEINDAPCHERVTLVYESERKRWFGKKFDTVNHHGFAWDSGKPYWLTLNGRAIAEIGQRADQRDLILLTTGSQKPIADVFMPDTTSPQRICAEWTVGYEGIVTPWCAFESSSFMHTVYALRKIEDGRDLDAVIPVMFDERDFPHVNTGKGDYLLYVGRVTLRKGPAVAAEVARKFGMRLLIAGPGVSKVEPGKVHGDWVTIEGDHVEYLGEINPAERAELMAGAYAVMAPTQYLEPFGGVAVEAQMAGTPAITTDWGAFRETVPDEWRFRSLAEALAALDRAADNDPAATRQRALDRYGFDAVGAQYERWFHRLLDLWGAGWYELPAAARVAH